MSIKQMASFPALMKLAHEVGRAKKSGSPAKVREAEERLEAYVEICRKSDGMITGISYGDMG